MKKVLVALLALLIFSTGMSLFASEYVYAYTEQDIMIDAGDHQIPATLIVPQGAEGETFPAVVMLHGNGSTRHEAGNAYDYTAPEMAKAGIATIRYDYIGNGDSTEDYIDFTYDKGIADAICCYEYLKGVEAVDIERVGIMGWSQGGRLTLLTAARNDVFKSALTWAGAFEQKDESAEYQIALENGYYKVVYDWREPLKQSPAYYECAMGIDYHKEAANIEVPYLIIQGTDDTSVVPETALEIQKALVSSPNAPIYWVENCDHTFNVFSGDTSALEETTAATITWFLATL